MPIENWAPWGRALVELIRAYVNTPGADTRSPEYMAELAREVVVRLVDRHPDFEPRHLLPPESPCEVYDELMRECGLYMVRIDRDRAEC